MMRRQSEFVTLNEPNQCVIGPAHLSGTFGYRIQYRLDVRRRAGDDPKDCTSRRLLLQRFLEFLEQSDVLKCDHSLVGEGFEEFDLRLREGPYFDASRGQSSNELPLLP